MKSRRAFANQRIIKAMRHAQPEGSFIVFDTHTMADDRLDAYYDKPNPLPH